MNLTKIKDEIEWRCMERGKSPDEAERIAKSVVRKIRKERERRWFDE